MTHLIQPNTTGSQEPPADGAGARLAGELATLMREIELYLIFWEHPLDGCALQGDEDRRSASTP